MAEEKQFGIEYKAMSSFVRAEKKLHEQYTRLVGGQYVDYPMIVSIETFSKCNADCDFCPYTTLERVGARLDTDYILSLIDEISLFPVPPQRLNLSRVNEPFLDKRLIDFLVYARSKLPDTQLVIFSNGQTLTNAVVERLNEIENFSLVISFNEHLADEYYRVMGISYEKTLVRLQSLHERKLRGELNFQVSLHRVGTSDRRDDEFCSWCNHNLPLFPVGVSARFDWVGSVGVLVDVVAPRAGCSQWFSLHILADKTEAFCCIDGVGQKRHLDGLSLLEIYNREDKRRLREYSVFRQDVDGCGNCLHGMPGLVE